MVVTTHPTKIKRRLPFNKKRGSDDTTSAWLTRNEAVDLLGVSQVTLLAFERRGKLHPKRVTRLDNGGHERLLYVYDPHELALIPQRGRSAIQYPGETAARAFELFAEGKPQAQIVIELRELPDKIRELYERWLDMGGADLVISPGAKEALEKIVGPFASVTELVERVDAIGKKRR